MEESDIDKRVKDYLKIGREDSALVIRNKEGKIASVIRFARAEWSDWEEIKSLKTEELIKRWISLSAVMEYSVSVRDCELETLMAMELDRRGVKYEQVSPRLEKAKKEIAKWLEETSLRR